VSLLFSGLLAPEGEPALEAKALVGLPSPAIGRPLIHDEGDHAGREASEDIREEGIPGRGGDALS